jgi:DNA-binding GntR family transcriptional regulator
MRRRRAVDAQSSADWRASWEREGNILQTNNFVRPQSLAERIADQIRSRIVKGDLQLGEALSETAIAAELGVSKTPVREAFLRLKTERLVDVLPQRGTFVFCIGAGDAEMLSEFRGVLEIAALRLAMEKDAAGVGQALAAIAADMNASLGDDDTAAYREQDGRFHQCIIDHCDNHYLSRSYALVALRIQALRNRLAMDPASNAASLEQHTRLGRLIGRGLEAEAVALLRKHIVQALDVYEKTLGLGLQSDLSS